MISTKWAAMKLHKCLVSTKTRNGKPIEHALFNENLKPLHQEPFDRILIAQAAVEGITLMTSDALVAQYSDAIIKV